MSWRDRASDASMWLDTFSAKTVSAQLLVEFSADVAPQLFCVVLNTCAPSVSQGCGIIYTWRPQRLLLGRHILAPKMEPKS